MNKTTKNILKHILIPTGFGVSNVFLFYILSNKYVFSWKTIFEEFIYSFILTLLFWKGNEFIIRSLNKRLSWVKHTKKIVTLHIASTIVYTSIVIVIFYLYIWFIVMHKKDLHGFFGTFKGGFFLCFAICAIATLFAYSYNLMKNLKQSVFSREKLEQESILLQYEALKNQVNPHFLFNSLNALASLIERDKDASINYVQQLSRVYRYVLEQNARETVLMETELKFIDAYIYLLKIRFGENFKVSINISELHFNVIPLAMQILIENAFKHNEISEISPLHLEIIDDKDYLIIRNNIQKRQSLPESNNMGLSNLKFQYGYLTSKKMEVTDDGSFFTVKLPKL